jgi:hypothetical protein
MVFILSTKNPGDRSQEPVVRIEVSGVRKTKHGAKSMEHRVKN